jgi:hypothetical protein
VSEFPACFLLVFAQLAVGGIAALAVPPFGVLERGFYKSSAGVFVASAVTYLVGDAALALRAPCSARAASSARALGRVHDRVRGLPGDALGRFGPAAGARAYAAALLGVAALSASANAYRLGPVVSPATLLYPLAFLTGALALGAVATGMLLGHWYLIDLGLSIEPMRRIFRWFVGAVVVHAAVLLLTVAVLAIGPSVATDAVSALWHENRLLLALRFLLGPLAALALGWMIHRTLLIPQTMAATGLFYIAILFVLVGEIPGRLILYRTSPSPTSVTHGAPDPPAATRDPPNPPPPNSRPRPRSETKSRIGN